ncbi:hypothetical protein N9818_00085 [Arcobacteraceae bacterium]|nr:hypothetical protein [Arcobacteraceae bacterium]
MLSDDFIEYVKQISSSSIETPTTNYGSTFHRFKYDVGNNDPIVLELIKDKKFRHTLNSLTKQKLFFLQGLAFELKKIKIQAFLGMLEAKVLDVNIKMILAIQCGFLFVI